MKTHHDELSDLLSVSSISSFKLPVSIGTWEFTFITNRKHIHSLSCVLRAAQSYQQHICSFKDLYSAGVIEHIKHIRLNGYYSLR